MLGPRYCPRQYVEGRKTVPVVLSRLYNPERNDAAYRSTYAVWNDDSGLRGCGLWDDVLFQKGNRGTATQQRNISRPIPTPKVTTPRRQIRFEALSAPKRYGQCGKPRCAATDHDHKPHCAADQRKERKGEKRPGTQTSTVKNTYTTMASIHVQDRIPNDANHDITMGLRNLKKVNASGELEDLPTQKPNCERNCGECSNSAQEPTEPPTESTNGPELKPSALRTMGTNTEKYCEEDYEIPVRVLKEQDNNIMEEYLRKATSPIARVKLPTPIPRVALLKPPKPKPYEHLNKLAKRMLKSDLQLRPKPWTSSPQSLTSRRTVPRKEYHPQTPQKRMGPGKLAPRLFTPPKSIPFTRTNSTSPRSQSSNQNVPKNQPESTTELQPTQPLNPQQALNPSETLDPGSTKEPSEQTSRGGSLVITNSDFDSSSEGASVEVSYKDSSVETASMYCLCSLCGKSESAPDGAQMSNNPLYSPPRSETRGVSWSPGGSAVSWRLFCTLLEVLVLVLLGGTMTLGLIPYVESVFRAYMADFCRCSGKGGGTGPELTADGMRSGIVKWVTCMMDDSRSTLTPLR